MLIKSGVRFQVPFTKNIMYLYKIIYISCYYYQEIWKILYKNYVF